MNKDVKFILGGRCLLAAVILLAGGSDAVAQEGEPAPPPPASTDVVGVESTETPVAGRFVRGMALNDLLQILARKAGYSLVSNPAWDGVAVSGHQVEGDPVEQIRELAVLYGFTLYSKGNMLFALSAEQVAALPRRELVYELQYLEPQNADQTEALLAYIQPFLSDGGRMAFDAPSRTIAVADNEYVLPVVRSLLEKRDRPNPQIALQIQILRIASDAAKRLGVDWSNSLGEEGTALGVTFSGSANEIFSTTPIFGDASTLAGAAADAAGAISGSDNGGEIAVSSSGEGIIISPIRLEAVVRALIENDVATQESGPTITVDNGTETSFEVVQKIPIVTQDVSQSNGENLISTQVSYTIDPDDPNTVIGIRIGVRPFIRPDGTVWMDIEPAVGTRTGETVASTGIPGIVNRYPNIEKVSVKTSARVPDGYTLLLGGYYTTEDREVSNKVPVLGDIPFLGFAFSSTQKSRVRSNIVFAITPTVYNPENVVVSVEQNERLRQSLELAPDSRSPDPENPGESTEPNFARAIRNFFPGQAASATGHPLDGANPDNASLRRIRTSQEIQERQIINRVRRAEPVGSPTP